MRDVEVSYSVFGIAIRVELTHDFHLPTFAPGITDGKLKTSFKVGEHGATMASGFGSATPLSATSTGEGLLETVSCFSKESRGNGWVVEMELGCRACQPWSNILQVGSPGFPWFCYVPCRSPWRRISSGECWEG